ncbi:MAG: hypothetical protein IKK55_02165 [Clostridia bacterium]|nr:hypothetical protein [Clostridia bacterium]
MKKVLAIILSIAMLFGVLAMNTFAETTKQPTVTVNSIEVELKKDSDFTITLGNFAEVAGMDVTITTEDDVVFKSVAANTGRELVLGTNYTISEAKDEIHIVELVTEGTESITLTVNATINEEATIAVKGEFADDGKTLFDVVNTTGSITELALEPVVEVKDQAATSTTIATPNKYFIPYGSLYNKVGDEYTYPEKDANGNFSVVAGTEYSYTQYLIPESKIMTFGVSDSKVDESPALQFGTYCGADTTNRGTLLIAGDVAELKQKYTDDATLIAKVNKLHDKYNPIVDGKYTYTTIKMNFTYNEENYTVRVYKVAQTKFMWQGNGAIEYAVRAYNLADNEDYAAVGYFTKDEVTTFADTLKVNY